MVLDLATCSIFHELWQAVFHDFFYFLFFFKVTQIMQNRLCHTDYAKHLTEKNSPIETFITFHLLNEQASYLYTFEGDQIPQFRPN